MSLFVFSRRLTSWLKGLVLVDSVRALRRAFTVASKVLPAFALAAGLKSISNAAVKLEYWYNEEIKKIKCPR